MLIPYVIVPWGNRIRRIYTHELIKLGLEFPEQDIWRKPLLLLQLK